MKSKQERSNVQSNTSTLKPFSLLAALFVEDNKAGDSAGVTAISAGKL